MNKKIYYLLLILTCSNVIAQETPIPLQYSFEQGTYFYFTDRAISRNAPFENITAARISRDNGRGGLKPLVTLTQANNINEFKTIAGEETWRQLKIIKNIQTDDQLWQYILAHPMLNDYGMIAFNIAFRQAMGSAYLDKESAGLAAGKRWSYRIEFLNATGGVVKTSVGTVEGGPRGFELRNVRRTRVFATDSSVFMQWAGLFRQPVQGMITADVYRQVAGKGAFRKLNDPILANIRNDSILFYFSENVVPQTLYRYYIRPQDPMGNPAPPSDTISLLSVNFAALPLLQNLQARDTLNGIRLNWNALGDVPQIVGIEVQRSRDARGNYVVLDTLSSFSNTFMDTQVLPDIPYFYRLRVIGLKGMERETGYSGYATAAVKNSLKNPDPPYGLEASLENGFVKITWEPVSDPDVYGYFVYRSNAEQGKFQVISPAIEGTQFIDSAKITSRTQYVYAVKAVTNSSLESDFSNKVAIRQAARQLPIAPGGVNAFLDNRTVMLSWPSTAKLDHNIMGYNIYRRESSVQRDFDTKESGAAQAARLNFILLNGTVVTTASYNDENVPLGRTYEYAVTSVDVFGMESTFSPFVSINSQSSVRIIRTWSVRKVTGGVMLEWDPALQQDTDAVSVYRKKAGDQTYQKLTTVGNGDTSYLDRSAQKGVLYIYQVRGERGNKAVSRSEEKNIRL